MSYSLICLIVSLWCHLICGKHMLLFLFSSPMFMDDWIVISQCVWWWWVTGAPEGSHRCPYDYNGFSEDLWYGRKITWIVKEDEGACSLVNCLRRWPTRPRRQRDLANFLAQEREGKGQEGGAWDKYAGTGVRNECWKIQLDCGEWELVGSLRKFQVPPSQHHYTDVLSLSFRCPSKKHSLRGSTKYC